MKELKVRELTVVGLASVTAPPAPALPKMASLPEIQAVLVEVDTFRHWFVPSHAPAASVTPVVAALASHVSVAAGAEGRASSAAMEPARMSATAR